jgi:hypothetical protein
LLSDRHKACAYRPRWLRHLDISESEPGAACDRAVLIGYGVANLVALLFPLDLSSNASVPMHIVATNMLLALMLAALMLAAMRFGAAAFHGWLRLSAIASLVTSVVGRRCIAPGRGLCTDASAGHRRANQHRRCPASASESASARSCCGLQFLPSAVGVRPADAAGP